MTCRVCGLTKDEEDFARNDRTGSFRRMCKACRRKQMREGRRERDTPEKRKSASKKVSEKYAALTTEEKRIQNRTRSLSKKYGLTPEDYEALNDQQGGVCAICGRPPNKNLKMHNKLLVDHDHQTNVVRGLLCWGCNVGLGLFGDSVDWLMDAAAYLLVSQNLLEEGTHPNGNA